MRRCDLCFAASHSAKECLLSADPEVELSSKMRAVESAVVAFGQKVAGPSTRKPIGNTGPSRLFNEKKCYSVRCRSATLV